jgi:hypothetical protein
MVLDIETAPDLSVIPLLPPVEAAGNLKDPEKIKASLAERTEKQLATMALEPDYGRIVCIGTDAGVVTCPDEKAEALALAWFWEQWNAHRSAAIGYNVIGFDLPFILTRSWILGVSCPRLEIRKYGMPGVLDLMLMLSHNGAKDFRKMDFWIKRLNIDLPDDPVSGKDIPALVEAGNWAAVTAHCKADVEKTAALATRLGVL